MNILKTLAFGLSSNFSAKSLMIFINSSDQIDFKSVRCSAGDRFLEFPLRSLYRKRLWHVTFITSSVYTSNCSHAVTTGRFHVVSASAALQTISEMFLQAVRSCTVDLSVQNLPCS